MIKKILFAVVAVIGFATVASARDTYVRNVSVLPQAAQTILSNNFKSKVSVIKIDKEIGRVSDYEVILTDGSEITFDRNGNWKEIEVGLKSKVPSSLIPKGISDYVNKNMRGQKIVGIEKERSGYDVELSNGIDMKFDKAGRFVRYDK